jgi:hypothetical protein
VTASCTANDATLTDTFVATQPKGFYCLKVEAQ